MGNDAGHGSVVVDEGDLVADDQKDEGDRPMTKEADGFLASFFSEVFIAFLFG